MKRILPDFDPDAAISVRDVRKRYRLGVINRKSFRDELVYRWLRLRGKDPKESMGKIGDPRLKADGWFHALDGVSFDIRKGEAVGLIGRNGAGKSTMLKILARITEPDEGGAVIRGRVGSLLEVGTGFHPELTGRENVYLNGTILGMKKHEIDAKFDEIVDFAEIGPFLDTPVKRYSSGMHVKLAFAVAACLDTDVLLVDEVLAVGDLAFRRKSLERMKSLVDSGKTIVFVSHMIPQIKALCSRCIWFQDGNVFKEGPAKEIADEYMEAILPKKPEPPPKKPEPPPKKPKPPPVPEKVDPATHADVSALPRSGKASGAIRFTGISVLDETGAETTPRCGAPFALRLSFSMPEPLQGCEFAVSLRAAGGQLLCAFPSRLLNDSFDLSAGDHVAELVLGEMPLPKGLYDVSLSAKVCGDLADLLPRAIRIEVADGDFFGVGRHVGGGFPGNAVLCRHKWEIDEKSRTGASLRPTAG